MKNQKQKLNILLPLFMLILGLQSCGFDANAIKGDGNVISVEEKLDAFNEIDASGMFKIFLVKGDEPNIRIETDENIHEYIGFSVKRNKLELEMESNHVYRPTRLHVFITTDKLDKINLSGATSLEADYTLASEELLLHVSGAGDIDLDVDVDKLMTKVSGAGSIGITGSADEHDVTLSGAASMKCVDLVTRITTIKLSGAGSADVFATEMLDANLSGVGSIRYAGEPDQTRISKTGIGSIKPV